MRSLTMAVLIVLLVGVPGQADSWELVWSDEFEVEGPPDPERWAYEEGFVRNRELQYYTRGQPQNARVADGRLVIEADTIHANVHTRKYNHTRGTHRGDRIEVRAPYERFHVYAVQWLPDRLDFYVDETRYFTYEKEEGAGEDVWPFDQPFHLIINLAIGGAWGGQEGGDESIFPQRFEIDYVRVYQPPDEAEGADVRR